MVARRWLRKPNVAGISSQLSALERCDDRVAIDDVIVVNASDSASATIHGVVSTLATNLRTDLAQYLRELDGADRPADDGTARGLVQLRDPAVLAHCTGVLPIGAEITVRLEQADPVRRVVRFSTV